MGISNINNLTNIETTSQIIKKIGEQFFDKIQQIAFSAITQIHSWFSLLFNELTKDSFFRIGQGQLDIRLNAPQLVLIGVTILSVLYFSQAQKKQNNSTV